MIFRIHFNPPVTGFDMGAIMKEHKGKVDGNLVRQIAAELLGD